MKNRIIKNNSWVLIDAKDKVLGRLASKIACILIGKNKIDYSYNHIFGDSVVVINVENILVTGNKFNNKLYYRHSGYPGGFKIVNFRDIFSKNPSFVLQNAIKGMLPKNKLRKIFLRRVKIYSGDIHPHFSQKPIILDI